LKVIGPKFYFENKFNSSEEYSFISFSEEKIIFFINLVFDFIRYNITNSLKKTYNITKFFFLGIIIFQS